MLKRLVNVWNKYKPGIGEDELIAGVFLLVVLAIIIVVLMWSAKFPDILGSTGICSRTDYEIRIESLEARISALEYEFNRHEGKRMIDIRRKHGK